MGTRKYKQFNTTLGEAVSTGVSQLTELGEECRAVVDGAPENLQESARIQTLGETADALENLDVLECPEADEALAVIFAEVLPRSKRQGLSRSDRRHNAVAPLEAAVSAMQDRIDELQAECDDLDDLDDLDDAHQSTPYCVIQTRMDALIDFRDEVQNVIAEAESVEFPGMFG